MFRHSNGVSESRNGCGPLPGLARYGRQRGFVAGVLAIGPDVWSVMTERAEQDAIRALRHDGRGNRRRAGMGRDRKAFGEKPLGTGAIHALDPVSPARVALLVGALAASVLWMSPGRTTGRPTRFAKLTRWTSMIGRSGVFVTRLTGLRW